METQEHINALSQIWEERKQLLHEDGTFRVVSTGENQVRIEIDCMGGVVTSSGLTPMIHYTNAYNIVWCIDFSRSTILIWL